MRRIFFLRPTPQGVNFIMSTVEGNPLKTKCCPLSSKKV